MCGRYTLTLPVDRLPALWPGQAWEWAGEAAAWTPRYNISPGERVLTVVARGEAARAGLMRWGLELPARPGQRLINLRWESLAGRPGFRDLARRGRCLLPADGFYEWSPPANGRLPFRCVPREGPVLWLAGVYRILADGPAVAIVTVPAVEPVAAVHARMPLALEGAGLKHWLDPAWEPRQAGETLPFATPPLSCYRVSSRVNRAGVEDPGLIRPWEAS
ncbi:Putative SOS response-associated peptidase [Candidatus Hydrogenisulfobacillus filiaventi]|uniref:Abasic site processing protein n=1 Tax=Candidatus Hydrogenisulfobacillus filiaventi TaxID=2707344 RepID=A0A6F8ZG95_9FIRM|nr:SOS response-associated peptidase [Bacillota bacterium]CAB1128800.1 Putative SOS response-associated peptidase [Candidatus Hydrogenisulfobacillus filiaventi]